jgi:hypothetical protein
MDARKDHQYAAVATTGTHPSAAGPPRLSDRSALHAHSIESSPHGNATADGTIEGQVKIVGYNHGVREQQPNSGRREVSYHAFDAEGSLKQDHTVLRTLVPRGLSPFSASVFGYAAVSDVAAHLEFRQPQPSLGLKGVQALNARILRAKSESNALQRLNLEPFSLRAFCHRRRACHQNMAGQLILDYLMFCEDFSLGIKRPWRSLQGYHAESLGALSRLGINNR